MTRPLLQLKNATVSRLGTTVFENLNWTVHKNENWVIIGPMASGKTTLLEAISGQLPVRWGEMNFMPENVCIDRWELRKYITLAAFRNELINGSDFFYQQRYNVGTSEPIPTVGDYLRNVDLLDPMVKLLGVEPLLPLELIKLSNGQTRRVLLAKAIQTRPALLLLDNPFAGLDREARLNLQRIIEDLLRDGQPIIVTCNYPEDIPHGTTHLLYLKQSGIAFQGRLKEGLEFSRKALQHSNFDDEIFLTPTSKHHAQKNYSIAVTLRNVTVRYGKNVVLDQVNWTVLRNEKWALMGKNGSGKSSLLSLINADNPQAYRNDIVLFDQKKEYGRSIWDIKKRIGFFSPELHAYFNENLSVFDTLATGYTDTFVPRKGLANDEEKRIHDLLAFYSLQHLADRPYRNLSSGEQRLILFLRSLVKTFDLLILDEPFQGFDATLIDRSRKLIDQYCQHTTLIFVTHYPREIPSCVTKVLTLVEGRVV